MLRGFLAALFLTSSSQAFSQNDSGVNKSPSANEVCTINPKILAVLNERTGLPCEEITAEELQKINSLAVNLQGTELKPSDFPAGLRPRFLSLSRIGNDDMKGVLAPLSSVKKLNLSLSFIGQEVNFRKEQYLGYFEDLQLETLALSHFQLRFLETFQTDPQLITRSQPLLTRLSINHSNIRYIPFHMFDYQKDQITFVDLSNNQISWFVGDVVGELPALKELNLSGNPLVSHFEMRINNCGNVNIKACDMGPPFDRQTFLSNVRRHPEHPACLCESSLCELTFQFCD